MKKILLPTITIFWGILMLILFNFSLTTNSYHIISVKMNIYNIIIHISSFFIFTSLILLIGSFLKKNYFITAITSFFISFNYIVLIEYLQTLLLNKNYASPDLFTGLTGTFLAISIGYMVFYSPKQKLLLHVCCGSCATWVIKTLIKDYNLTLFFYNPGIYPKEEYKLRLKDTKKVAKQYIGLKVIEGKYNHNNWKKKIAGHETDLEGGERCKICYYDRLEKTAKLAKKLNIPVFTTTLSISPHKKTEVINNIGMQIAKKHNLLFYAENFKAKDGFKKSVEMSKKLKLHRQNYCGCEYSFRK